MQHDALRLVRQFHNMKLTELAERFDVSSSYLSQIEHGRKKPSLELLEKYSDEFNIPLSNLFLFAESLQNPRAERIRIAVLGKALRMLQWLEDVTKDEVRSNRL